MKHGDFTNLAKYYVNRPGYSETILSLLKSYVVDIVGKDILTVADVGAGTGKLTEDLMKIGLSGFAVEPNDAMRSEGKTYLENFRKSTSTLENSEFLWSKGSAEYTGLADHSVDWVLMGSSFHWTKPQEALEEFNRILKDKGMFTAVYNPRDIEKNEFHQMIERKIKEIVPELNRVSSGSAHNVHEIESKLLASSHFGNLFFCEAAYTEVMSKERYMGAWLSVNDIQVQAGEERWERILEMIEQEISMLDNVEVPYKTRAWTVIKK